MAKTHLKYCLPIVKPSKNLVLQVIADHTHEYDYFEVWFDHIQDIDAEFVSTLQHKLGARLIAKHPGPNLSLFYGSPALVDVDIASNQGKLKVNLITSYHNYQETPDDKKLEEIIDLMSVYKPKIYKIATQCNSNSDALRLLQLLLRLKKSGLRCVIIGMGQIGRLTRIAGAMWGNEFTYAPLTGGEKTAPGQLYKSQLELILKQLHR